MCAAATCVNFSTAVIRSSCVAIGATPFTSRMYHTICSFNAHSLMLPTLSSSSAICRASVLLPFMTLKLQVNCLNVGTLTILRRTFCCCCFGYIDTTSNFKQLECQPRNLYSAFSEEVAFTCSECRVPSTL